MTQVTVVTPCAKHHVALLDDCKTSVQGQTVPCTHLIGIDNHGRGPGYVRNQLVLRAQTPYVVFLDADDLLEPTFAETALQAIRNDVAYVYTDWYEHDTHRHAPARGWCGTDHHLVTTLLRRDVFLSVGGFDESLSALEDTDFYLKLNSLFHCGVRVPQPLVHYTNRGHRAKAAHADGRVIKLKQLMVQRYGGKMGCCGGLVVDRTPVNQEEPGTVLAMAMWGGNRRVRGLSTGRMYPRLGNGKLAWVYPADIDAMPGMWRRMKYDQGPTETELQIDPDPDALTVIELGAAAYE